jgi:addiction module HigA family antidote
MNKNATQPTIRLPKNRPPVPPGEVLVEEYMLPYGITQQDMSSYLKISRKHLIDIIHARRPLSLEIAQRLAKFFQTSIDFWIQGQVAYDIWHAMRHPSKELKEIRPFKMHLN